MDLSKLSNQDLLALKSGDISKVSTQGLKALQSMQTQNLDPTANMSGGKRFLAGIGKAMVDIGRGAGQMVGAVSQEDIDRARELDKPLMETGAGMAGNVVGNIAATLPTAFIPGVNTITGGAATGAVLGALQPTGTGESRLNNAIAGGAIGGVIPAATNAFKAVKAGIYDPIASQDKIIASTLTKMSGNDPRALIQALRQGSAKTPGVNLTAGQLSRNEGIAAIEDALIAQNPSGELARNAQRNRSALADALRGVAGTPEDMTQALAAREASSSPIYDVVKNKLIKADDELTSLLQRPAVKNAMREAEVNALNRGARINPIDISESTAISTNTAPNVNRFVQGDTLHELKMALDAQKNYNPMGGMNKAQSQAIGEASGAFNNWLERNIPEYQQARQTYQQMSEPINQMQIGEALAKKLIPATADDMPASLNYSTFANSMRNPDLIAQQATGFKGAKMAEMLKDKMPIVEGVNADVSRIAEALKRGSGTQSATARRLSQGDMISQYFADQAPITSSLLGAASKVPGAGIASKGISTVGSLVTDKLKSQMLNRMDEMLANNPKQVADLVAQELSRIAPSQRQQIIARLPQAVVLSLPASINAAQ